MYFSFCHVRLRHFQHNSQGGIILAQFNKAGFLVHAPFRGEVGISITKDIQNVIDDTHAIQL